MQRKSPSITRSSRKSEILELYSISEIDVSKRKQFKKAKTASPPPLTIKTRSRTKSVDLTPSKISSTRMGNYVDDENESVTSGMSTRSRRTRATSISSVKSG